MFPAFPELDALKRGLQDLVNKALSSLVNALGLTPQARAAKSLKGLEKLEIPKTEVGSS
ncbi:hypothetical protein [Candidatus Protochlamydia phocaeensis]|uniref:hypothetical protein n=1 Tax=Candidatus Protochlamydia phocaeensis TaxID=1414722 RepID=UPI000AC9626B|nr:hypothetical protein [Candidatus Protochlamydia phocaeensis]